MRRALALATALGLSSGPALAHPHIYIDTGLDFVFDAEGRLTDLKVTWIYDALTSLFMLEDLGIDADAPLSVDDRSRLAAYQTEWEVGYDGDSYLWDGPRRIGLSGPEAPDAVLRDGKAAISFTRSVAAPFRPGAETVVKVYDPSYFTAYMVTAPIRLEGGADGCATRVEPFTPGGPLLALQQSLSSLPADATPQDEDVGALFADKVFIACD